MNPVSRVTRYPGCRGSGWADVAGFLLKLAFNKEVHRQVEEKAQGPEERLVK